MEICEPMLFLQKMYGSLPLLRIPVFLKGDAFVQGLDASGVAFPRWERFIPRLGIFYSQGGNNTRQ